MKRLVVVAIAGAVVLIGRTTLSSQSKPTPPTFAKDVAPIVQKNCMSCHRDGQAAPFPLVTYDDVKKRGQLIADVTEDRYMPPWHAARAEGFLHSGESRFGHDGRAAQSGSSPSSGRVPRSRASSPAAKGRAPGGAPSSLSRSIRCSAWSRV